MKVYGILRDYEGLDFDAVYSSKANAEKALLEIVKEFGYDKDEFRVIEIEVK